MTIQTCFESKKYRYDFDTLYGTGWFVRLSDDHVTLMATGIEAEEDRKRFLLMDTKKRCVNINPDEVNWEFDNEADCITTWNPRWGKEINNA
jgi:hypothetical protein